MDISRRSFLRGALVVSAASVLPAIPAFAEDIPTLYGDGIHDDAPALNALFNRRKARVDGEVIQVTDNVLHLKGGNYLISEPISVKGSFSAMGPLKTIFDPPALFMPMRGKQIDYMFAFENTDPLPQGPIALLRNYSEQAA